MKKFKVFYFFWVTELSEDQCGHGNYLKNNL